MASKNKIIELILKDKSCNYDIVNANNSNDGNKTNNSDRFNKTRNKPVECKNKDIKLKICFTSLDKKKM